MSTVFYLFMFNDELDTNRSSSQQSCHRVGVSLNPLSVLGDTDRKVCYEKDSSTWHKLVPDMTRGWLTMERTSLSIPPLRPSIEGIQPSLTAGHSRPLQEMLQLARKTVIMSSKSQHVRQRGTSALTSLDHPPSPGDQSLAKVTPWRTRWEPGGWETARRV